VHFNNEIIFLYIKNKYRHTHIAEVSEEVSKQFNQFISENKAASSVAKGRQG